MLFYWYNSSLIYVFNSISNKINNHNNNEKLYFIVQTEQEKCITFLYLNTERHYTIRQKVSNLRIRIQRSLTTSSLVQIIVREQQHGSDFSNFEFEDETDERIINLSKLQKELLIHGKRTIFILKNLHYIVRERIHNSNTLILPIVSVNQ